MQVINNSAFQAGMTETTSQALSKVSNAEAFRLEVVNSATEDSVKNIFSKTLNQTLDSWTTIINNRLSMTKSIYSENNKKYLEDKNLVSKYQDLIKTTLDQISDLSGKKVDKARHIFILADSDGHIQAISSVKERLARLDIDTLISAPWNVPMNSQNPLEYKNISVKGAGTTVMRQVYEFAKERNKGHIELRPIESARSYYVDYLKMIPDDFTPAVRLPVSKDTVPEKLNVLSGNLLQSK